MAAKKAQAKRGTRGKSTGSKKPQPRAQAAPQPTPPRVSRPIGRPTELTPAVQDTLADLLRRGMTRQAAAAAVGIGWATLKEWVARGEGTDPDREPTEIYAAFAAAIREAEASFEAEAIADIRAATTFGGAPDWKAKAWLLERRFPEQWGNRTKQEVKQEVSGPGGKPIQMTTGVVVLPAEEPDGQDGG